MSSQTEKYTKTSRREAENALENARGCIAKLFKPLKRFSM